MIDRGHDSKLQNMADFNLVRACERGDIEEVQDLLRKYKSLREVRSGRYNETLLHIACRNGHFELVKILIEDHKCNVNAMNNIGWTPLHETCRNGDLEVVKMLVEEHHCDVNAKDNIGWTPLHDACRNGQLTVVRLLIENYLCDPSIADHHENTPLHLACHHGYLSVVRLLIENNCCDPSIANRDGNTPLHLACEYIYRSRHSAVVKYFMEHMSATWCDDKGWTLLHYACRFGLLEHVQYLIEDRSLNPSCSDKNGETPLHLACKRCHSAVVKYFMEHMSATWCDDKGWTLLYYACRFELLEHVPYLVERRSCNPSCTDKNGETPLHWACKRGHHKIAKFLMMHMDPSWTDKDGETLLHFACRYGYLESVQYLIEHCSCNPFCTDKNGETPLHWACDNRHHEIAKFLMKHMDPSWTDKNGETLLHLACRYQYGTTVSYLLSVRKVDPNRTSSDGRTALTLTYSSDIIRELLRNGATADYKVWKDHLPSNCPGNPAKLAVKTFVVGNPGTGKSTLTKGLQTESKGLSSVMNRIVKVAGVDKKTAGVIPYDMDSKEFGRLTLYDFAGQKEFYASHDAVLRSAVSGSPSAIFLIVADLRISDEDFRETIRYWLAFLENQGISADPKPHAIVIASHADQVKVKVVESKRGVVESLHQEKTFSSFNYVGFVALNCQYAKSSSMSQLRNLLAKSCKKFRSVDEMSFRSHCFLVFLLDKFRDCPAVQIGKVSKIVVSESERDPRSTSLASCIPTESSEILQLCDELNQRGNILFLKDAQGGENSWIILEREALLSRVTGTVFAPENFKQHCDLATSTGVVPFSKLQTHLPDLNTDMITQFLCHLEFCRLLASSEILDAESAAADFDPTEKLYFFPGLVRIEMPSGVWKSSPNFVFHSGWALHCSNPGQFFTPRFLQVLLLRLAFNRDLASNVQTPNFPALQRKCQVWKNGIFWGDDSGVEALVDVEENKSVVVMLRCLNGSEVECARIQSTVIDKIQQIIKTFCPKVTVSEHLLHYSNCKEYPHKPFTGLALVNAEQIAAAVIKQKPSIVDEVGKVIPLSEILGFRPDTCFGISVLQQLFGDQNPTPHKPTLSQLMKMKTTSGEEVKIIMSVAPQWKELGALLDIDTEGRTLNLIEADHQREGHAACCREMFMSWLECKGEDATWAVLIEALNDIDQSELAKQIQTAI